MEIKWLLLILIVLVIVLFMIANRVAVRLVNAAVERDNDWYRNMGHKKMNPEVYETHPELEQRETLEKKQGDDFWQTGEDVSVTSHDNLVLKGKSFLHNPDKWVIAVHGYRSDGKKDMAYVGDRYRKAGYSVLIPDLRAHGKSQGEFIGMGWLDRLDLLIWIQKIIQLYPDADIVLHGGSMGAAAVLMSSGENLPVNVSLIIADSGFSSVYAEFKQILLKALNLPKFPLLKLANRYAKKRIGYSLIEASATKQLASNQLPVLVVHGGADQFVPIRFAEQILMATAGESEFLEIPEAGHLMGMTIEPELYWETLFCFIDKYQK